MAAYFFLPADYEELNRKIYSLYEQLRAAGQEMGASCEEGA